MHYKQDGIIGRIKDAVWNQEPLSYHSIKLLKFFAVLDSVEFQRLKQSLKSDYRLYKQAEIALYFFFAEFLEAIDHSPFTNDITQLNEEQYVWILQNISTRYGKFVASEAITVCGKDRLSWDPTDIAYYEAWNISVKYFDEYGISHL